MNNKIKFAKLRENVIIPTKREEDAGYDIYANFEEDYLVINSHETKMIPTGLISAFSSDYVAIVKERGSTGSKGIGQRAGVIDSGYRNEWFIPITNHSKKTLVIAKKGIEDTFTSEQSKFGYGIVKDKENNFVAHKNNYFIYPYEKAIAQCIMVEVPKLKIEEVSIEEIKSIGSERGNGKLGSSGK